MFEKFYAYRFEFSDVVADGEAELAEVEYWVEDDLAGVVGGCAASAADFDEVYAFGFEGIGVEEELVCTLAGAEGDDGVVLDEQDGVGDLALFSLFVEVLLEVEDLAEVGTAAVADV